MTEEAKKFGLAVGMTMDLTTGCDFTEEEDKQRAMKYIREHKPKLIIGSPTCRMFSQPQRLSTRIGSISGSWQESTSTKWIKADGSFMNVLSEHLRGAFETQAALIMDGVEMVQGDHSMSWLKTSGMNGKA